MGLIVPGEESASTPFRFSEVDFLLELIATEA